MSYKREWTKTLSLIPDGVQTLSKMPSKHVEGVYPTYLDRGEGAYVYDLDDKMYIDFPLGLGAVLLGHADPRIVTAVNCQISRGNLMSLPNLLETEVAEQINEMIPSMEKMRFLKTGSEATSAAVKIARAYTKRKKIVVCGYHGWHDWYNVSTKKNQGVPREMAGLVKTAKFNDINSFRKLIDGNTAAVIMEPYVYEAPDSGFYDKLAAHIKTKGALLIFDEVVTGFRSQGNSAQAMFDVTPDLTCLGKTLANGLPLSCVGGRKDIMDVLTEGCFVSSTYGGELVSLAAAKALLSFVKTNNVIDQIWEMGHELKSAFNNICEQHKIDAKCIGYPCRTHFVFPTAAHKSLFWQQCVRRGVLFGHAQFISWAHDARVMTKTCEIVRESLLEVKEWWDEPETYLDGPAATETLRHVKNETR